MQASSIVSRVGFPPGTILTIAARIAVVASGILAGLVTARILGPAGRGEYYYAVNLASIATQIATLGLVSANTYYVASDRKSSGALLANSVVVALGVGTGAALFVAGLLVWLTDTRWSSVVGTLLVAPAMLLFLFTTNLLVPLGRVVAFNVLQCCNGLFALASIFVVARLGLSAPGFLIAAAVGPGLSGILGVLLVYRSSPRVSPSIQWFRRTFRYAAKAYVVTLLGFLAIRTTIFLAMHVGGTEQAGYFSISMQAADAMAMIPQSLAIIIFPGLVGVTNIDGRWEHAMTHVRQIAKIMGILCIAAAPLIYWFVPLFFGLPFQPAVTSTLYILPGVWFLSISNVVSQYLAACGFPLRVAIDWTIALLLTVLCGVPLISRFGADGASITFSIANVGLCCLLSYSALLTRRKARALAASGVCES